MTASGNSDPEEIRKAVAEGVAAAEAGDVRDGQEVANEIREMLRQRRSKSDPE